MSTPPPNQPGSPYPGSYFDQSAQNQPQPGFSQPPYSPPPAPVRRRSFGWIRIVVTLALIAGGAAYYFLVYKKQDISSASVGDCMEVASASTTDPDLRIIDCGNPKAFYQITQTGSVALRCDDMELTYTVTGGRNGSSTGVCLVENLAEGDCWEEHHGPASLKLACADVKEKSGIWKVTKVDKTSSDGDKCPKDTVEFYANKTRNSLICFADLK